MPAWLESFVHFLKIQHNFKIYDTIALITTLVLASTEGLQHLKHVLFDGNIKNSYSIDSVL